MTRLSFAVLFAGASLERWHLDCLDRLEEVAELRGVIFAPAEGAARARRDSLLLRWYQRRVADPPANPAQRFAGVTRYDVESLRASIEPPAFDFVLKLGPGAALAEHGCSTRFGTWHFEHELRRAGMSFFREVYEGEDVTRTALLATTSAPGVPALLEEGFFRTEQHSYRTSRNRILDAIAAWPARACVRIQAGESELAAPVAPRAEPPGEAPVRILRYHFLVSGRRVALAWRRLFRHPQWNIGVMDVAAGEVVDGDAYQDDRIKWLPLPGRTRFFADPFGVEREGTLHILCESFSYRESRGTISRLALDGRATLMTPKRTLPLDEHASYPFLIEDAGELYCVPETSASSEVALFRAHDFPRAWCKAGVLLSGFRGVDPTIFRHGGRWWLLCTRKGVLEDVELWAWHAPSLLGPWTMHARNPVKSDVRGSRPAGRPFHHDGALYRPAQDCSRRYGWRIAIQRVTRLTPTEFAEERVRVLEAAPGSEFPLGRHTLTPVGDRVLIDGRRDVFVWAAFRAFVGIWARECLRRAPGRRRGRRGPPR